MRPTHLLEQAATSDIFDLTFNSECLASFKPVSETDVLKNVKLSAPKSCEIDGLPTHLLLECIDLVLSSLTKVI